MYRLNVFPLHLPPLRGRGDDVILLAEMFARNLAQRRGRSVAPLSESQKSRLRAYEWPGNVRELQNVIDRAFITSLDGKTLNLDRALPDLESLPPAVHTLPSVGGDDRVLSTKELKELERKNIERALVAANGRISGPGGAADLLGLNANTLSSRLKALGISKQ